jgi:hypothetical protein
MDSRLHLLDSFAVRASDGALHKVFAYERRIAEPNLVYPDQWASSGVTEYRLESGEPVLVRRDGSMRAAHSGVTLEPL